MTPVYLKALGRYDYGVWEIVGSLTGYLGLLDIGLRPTISRFIARISPAVEGHHWRKVYSTSFFLMAGAGLVIGSVFLGWSFLAPDKLADQPARAARYALFLQLFALQVALAFPRFGLESALEGGQRYLAKNNIILLHTILSAIFLFFFIFKWDPLLMLCSVNIIIGLSKMACFLWMLAPPGRGPKIPIPWFFSFDLAREMYRFGIKSFLQGAASIVERRADVLIIGFFLGPAVVVFYSLPQAILTKIRGLTWNVTHALMPAFSELDAHGQNVRAKKLFIAYSSLVTGMITMLCTGAVIFGGHFISLWVGQIYVEKGAIILYILSANLFIGMFFPLGSRYLTAVGRHGPLAKIGAIKAATNIAISLSLVIPMGAPGVALGSLFTSLIALPMESKAVLYVLKIRFRDYLRKVMIPALFPAASMAAFALIGNRLGWTSSWAGFILTGGSSSLIFIFLYALFSVNKEDRYQFKRLLWPNKRPSIIKTN